ncbi:hypothetical protein CAXC1_150019 [Candidatus Xenohaliotis californiensis]|uniref:Uncharacterized protein n=1 Tax=Candidatus Xenohaliotis californiensis TaxID=84677 RepID=A0ABM9N761_9RICK|nr:hypothetical protein CAXC1_150019 [Candidatus Xenohaliotis californiensis]
MCIQVSFSLLKQIAELKKTKNKEIQDTIIAQIKKGEMEDIYSLLIGKKPDKHISLLKLMKASLCSGTNIQETSNDTDDYESVVIKNYNTLSVEGEQDIALLIHLLKHHGNALVEYNKDSQSYNIKIRKDALNKTLITKVMYNMTNMLEEKRVVLDQYYKTTGSVADKIAVGVAIGTGGG